MAPQLFYEQISDTDTLTIHSISGGSLDITVRNATTAISLTVGFTHIGSILTGLGPIGDSDTQRLALIFDVPLHQVYTRLSSLLQRAVVLHEVRPLVSL